MSGPTYRYESLPSSSEHGAHLLPGAAKELNTRHRDPPQESSVLQRHPQRVLLLTSILSCLLTLCAVWIFGSPTLEECGRRLSAHSPALEAITYLAPSHFKAAIVQTNRWRGKLGHDPRDYDEAWASIGSAVPGLRLYDEDLKKLGKLTGPEPGQPLHRIPEEEGGGVPALLEVFHLLHCLDWLRKSMFYNWDYYKDTPKYKGFSARELEAHNDHCIDVLRMHLMCAADVTPVTYYDTPYRALPFGDFGTKHTCRDFDAILEWSKTTPRAFDLHEMGSSTLWKGDGEAT